MLFFKPQQPLLLPGQMEFRRGRFAIVGTDRGIGIMELADKLRGGLKLPEGTQNGRQFRLAGQGMPRLNSSAKGDLYARIKVVLSTELTARERELFQELRRARAGTAAGVAS